jgi:hypothetical protein
MEKDKLTVLFLHQSVHRQARSGGRYLSHSVPVHQISYSKEVIYASEGENAVIAVEEITKMLAKRHRDSYLNHRMTAFELNMRLTKGDIYGNSFILREEQDRNLANWIELYPDLATLLYPTSTPSSTVTASNLYRPENLLTRGFNKIKRIANKNRSLRRLKAHISNMSPISSITSLSMPAMPYISSIPGVGTVSSAIRAGREELAQIYDSFQGESMFSDTALLRPAERLSSAYNGSSITNRIVSRRFAEDGQSMYRNIHEGHGALYSEDTLQQNSTTSNHDQPDDGDDASLDNQRYPQFREVPLTESLISDSEGPAQTQCAFSNSYYGTTEVEDSEEDALTARYPYSRSTNFKSDNEGNGNKVRARAKTTSERKESGMPIRFMYLLQGNTVWLPNQLEGEVLAGFWHLLPLTDEPLNGDVHGKTERLLDLFFPQNKSAYNCCSDHSAPLGSEVVWREAMKLLDH